MWLKKNGNYNDEEIAKYAKTFNSLCKKNNITSFWWDTNFLVNRQEKWTFQKIIDAIMSCYTDWKEIKNQNNCEFESAENCVNNMKTGWNLGNTLDAYDYRCFFDEESNSWKEKINLSGLATETKWHMPKTTAEMIKYIKNLGFNAVRIPITWVGHLNNDNIIDNDWMNRVKETVDYVIDENMYCILNVHHDGGANGWVKACESSYNQFSSRLEKIYEQISKTFGDYDEKLLFGSVNEILDENSSWEEPTKNASFWEHKWNQLFVDTVRKSGGKNKERNLVVMAPAGKNSKIALEQFEMPSDSAKNHLIFEFHNYDPQSFCWHQNKEGTNYGETPLWNDEKDTKILESIFENLMPFAKKLNAPIICGEYAAWIKEL